MPINAYEVGYLSRDQTDFATVRKVIDHAARYHATMNMFQHPVYIANFPACRAAIEEGLRLLEERGLRARHMGNDELFDWWSARSNARVERVTWDGSAATAEVASDYAAGVVLKVALGTRTAGAVTIDGAPDPAFRTEARFGRHWVLAAVPRGRWRVRFEIR